MNAAQKLEAAVSRLEAAAAELRHAALKYAEAAPSSWDKVNRDQDLASCARKYATAQLKLRRALNARLRRPVRS